MQTKKLITVLLILCGIQLATSAQEILLLKTSGKVVVGDTSQITTPDGYNLFVQNGILTEKVKVAVKSTAEWSDDAWSRTPTIAAVQSSITEHKHLVDMPSAATLVSEGYDLQQMDAKILAQVEWLWQHMIKVTAENEALKRELTALKAANLSTVAPTNGSHD